jgi:hypothetical protein
MTEQIDPARQAGASNTTTWSGAAADVRTPPFLAHPKDVLDDAAHSVEQKRLILASWLSDRHAVPDAPRWRELENGAFVDAHEIEQALRILDDIEASGRNGRHRSEWAERTLRLIFLIRAAKVVEGRNIHLCETFEQTGAELDVGSAT